MKVGIVNLGRLLNEVPMYTEAREKIKKQFDPRARNLKTLEKSGIHLMISISKMKQLCLIQKKNH